MNIVFLIEDSPMNMKHTISFISERIKSSLQIESVENLKEDNNYGVYKFLRREREELYLECYRIKDENKYLVNIININEEEKNNLIELIVSDQLFQNNIVLIDSLSNQFIAKEYKNFILLENHLKQYFALKLLGKYGAEAYKILDNIKTKEDIVILPSNIKTNLQKIELVNLIENIVDKPLGGQEYETYFDKYNKDDLEPLKLSLKEDIFSDIKKDLQDNKSIIKEYRNIICHNRFLNCKSIEIKHCTIINELINKLIGYNNYMLNSTYGTNNCRYYDDTGSIEKQRFTFSLKKALNLNDNKLLLINLLLKLNLILMKYALVLKS